jgi:cyclophilin family peptidyl-prolyl cis-trans isomerase
MRFFRADNHFLWMGVLVTVALTIYLSSAYLDAPCGTSDHPTTTDTLTNATPTRTPDVPPNARRRRATPGAKRVTFAETFANEDVTEDVADTPVRSGPHQPRGHASPKTRNPVALSQGHAQKHTRSRPSSLPSHVFLDVAKQDFLKDPFVGKVVIELYGEQAPQTVRNFAQLCTDKKYVNTPFHRVIKDFMVQGGDLVNQDGTGTYSIYGGEGSTFADEPFAYQHDQPGLLSMANSGPNTNGSQFFITTAPAPHLDGKHVVFGRVVQGLEHVHDLEREVTDTNDRPIRKCYVMNCGVAEAPSATPARTPPMSTLSSSQSQAPPRAQALETFEPAAQSGAMSGGESGWASAGFGANASPLGLTDEPVPFQI